MVWGGIIQIPGEPRWAKPDKQSIALCFFRKQTDTTDTADTADTTDTADTADGHSDCKQGGVRLTLVGVKRWVKRKYCWNIRSVMFIGVWKAWTAGCPPLLLLVGDHSCLHTYIHTEYPPTHLPTGIPTHSDARFRIFKVTHSECDTGLLYVLFQNILPAPFPLFHRKAKKCNKQAKHPPTLLYVLKTLIIGSVLPHFSYNLPTLLKIKTHQNRVKLNCVNQAKVLNIIISTQGNAQKAHSRSNETNL